MHTNQPRAPDEKVAQLAPDGLPQPEGWFDRIIQFSIRNAIWVMLFVLTWIGVGIYSYQQLPIDAVPDITNTQVQINTQATGFTALEVEQRITYPIETAMAGLPELQQTRSISRYGLSQVTIIFLYGTYRTIDQTGAIIYGINHYAFGQRLLHLLQFGIHGLGNATAIFTHHHHGDTQYGFFSVIGCCTCT